MTNSKNCHSYSLEQMQLPTGAFLLPNMFRSSLTVIFICAWLLLPWLAPVLRQQMCAADSVSSDPRFPLPLLHQAVCHGLCQASNG